MDQMIIDVLGIEAERLAKGYSISNINRVLDIFMKTAIDCRGERFHINRTGQDPLRHGLEFYPSLFEALNYLPQESALSLFEKGDIDELAIKESLIRYWRDPWAPYYSLIELKELCSEFIEYLKASKSSLISLGYPKTDFAKSKWLFHYLSLLNPVKIPHSTNKYGMPYYIGEDTGLTVNRDTLGNQIFEYIWLTEEWNTLKPSETQKPCSYEKAPIIDGFCDDDINFIDETRAILFNLKLDILGIAQAHIQRRLTNSTEQSGLWNDSIDLIADQLSISDFKRFDELERKYINVFLMDSFSDGSSMLHGNPVTGISKDLNAGGIKNLIEFIFHVEKELIIGKIHRTKTALDNLTHKMDYASYYELAGHPNIEQVDEILLGFLSYEDQERKLDSEQSERLTMSIHNKFKMPLLVSPQKYDAIKAFAQFIEATEKIGIEIIGSFLKSRESHRKIQRVDLPSGCKWENITIRFINGNDITIKCGDLQIDSDFKQMGFENRHERTPDLQWNILVLLSEHNGEAIWDLRRGPRLTKERKQTLKKRLIDYFQIDDDPFYPIREIGHYKIRINLIPQ